VCLQGVHMHAVSSQDDAELHSVRAWVSVSEERSPVIISNHLQSSSPCFRLPDL